MGMKIFRLVERGRVVSYAVINERIYVLNQDPVEALKSYPRVSVERSDLKLEDLEVIHRNMVSEPRFAKPYEPLEIWGSGITYAITRRRYSEDEVIARIGDKNIYEHVYEAERPEIFFKATSNRCVAHGEPIAIRRDSRFTLPEPELGVVIGSGGRILGFTIANDVSARDIEAENPLYLPQSKTYMGCCSFGPYVVTPDEVMDPYSLTIKLRILRGGRELFEGENSTRNLKRSLENIIEYLVRDNPVPDGTLLMTGAAVLPGREHALAPGDTVEIYIDKIGVLINPVIKLG